jgi:hypothetical protein
MPNDEYDFYDYQDDRRNKPGWRNNHEKPVKRKIPYAEITFGVMVLIVTGIILYVLIFM